MYNVTENTNSVYGRNPMPTIEAIERAENTIVGITYKKMNGEWTEFHGRTGVKKHLKNLDAVSTGGDVKNAKHITIYDFQRKEYRTLIKSGIKQIRANGLIIDFE